MFPLCCLFVMFPLWLFVCHVFFVAVCHVSFVAVCHVSFVLFVCHVSFVAMSCFLCGCLNFVDGGDTTWGWWTGRTTMATPAVGSQQWSAGGCGGESRLHCTCKTTLKIQVKTSRFLSTGVVLFIVFSFYILTNIKAGGIAVFMYICSFRRFSCFSDIS